jgi:hypothetical protein
MVNSVMCGNASSQVPEVMFQPRLLSTFTLVSPESFTARQDGTVAQPLPGKCQDATAEVWPHRQWCAVTLVKGLHSLLITVCGISRCSSLPLRQCC